MMSKVGIIIGDSHARLLQSGFTFRRFEWLSRLIADVKPNFIVEVGDFGDFPSLSSYDGSRLTGGAGGKKSFQGKRYKTDVDITNQAREILLSDIKKAKKKLPRCVALGGNHDEGRIERAVENNPELEGLMSVDDIRGHKEWEFHDYLVPVEVEGFVCSHYFPSGVMGKPIGGEYKAANTLKKTFSSTIQGHDHLWDLATRMKANGKKIQSLVAGCYLDPRQKEAYAGPAQNMWASGITVLRDVENGVATGGFEFISVNRMEELYA